MRKRLRIAQKRSRRRRCPSITKGIVCGVIANQRRPKAQRLARQQVLMPVQRQAPTQVQLRLVGHRLQRRLRLPLLRNFAQA